MCSLDPNPQTHSRSSSIRVITPNALRNDFRAKQPIWSWLLVLLVNCTVPGLSSCYLPPVWQLNDAIDRVDTIKPGVTTREEVLARFGKPDWQTSAGDRIEYWGTKSKGVFMMLPPRDPAEKPCCMIGKKNWVVTIQFDEHDIVTNVSTKIEASGNSDVP
jgi:hypothetical protein